MLDGTDIAALKTALAVAEVKASEADARAANAEAKVSDAEAEIAFLKLTIEKLRREFFGSRSAAAGGEGGKPEPGHDRMGELLHRGSPPVGWTLQARP